MGGKISKRNSLRILGPSRSSLWLEPKVTEELWKKTDCRVRHQRGQGTKVLARCWSRDIPGSTYSCISRPEACYLLLTGVKNSEWRGIWWRKTGRDLGPVILNHFCLAHSYFSLNFFFFFLLSQGKNKTGQFYNKACEPSVHQKHFWTER